MLCEIENKHLPQYWNIADCFCCPDVQGIGRERVEAESCPVLCFIGLVLGVIYDAHIHETTLVDLWYKD